MIRNLMRVQHGFCVVNHRPAFVGAWRFAVVLAVLVALLPFRSALAQQRIYIPLVAVTQRNVAGSGELRAACSLSKSEQNAANLIAQSAEQQRTEMICNPILAEVARAKAKDMAERGYFGHTDPDGIGPNFLVVEAGYELPDWYSKKRDANNVESIAAGYGTAGDVVKGWEDSDGHRRHILGLNDFYKEQVIYGIGHYQKEGSPYVHYWVFLSAHPEGGTTAGVPVSLPEAMPEGSP